MPVGVPKSRAEAFSFALAVVLTPPVVAREVIRLVRAQSTTGMRHLPAAVAPCLLGAVLAFLAGLIALKWLSRWLEGGRWYFFGIYCVIAAGVRLYSIAVVTDGYSPFTQQRIEHDCMTPNATC